MIVIIFDELVDIYVFIVFFLNGDYVNDWLNIYVNILQVEKVLVFWIFDCWGGLMFENKNFLFNWEQLGWDGIFCGQQMDFGVYIYMVILELIFGGWKMIGGYVLLMQ